MCCGCLIGGLFIAWPLLTMHCHIIHARRANSMMGSYSCLIAMLHRAWLDTTDRHHVDPSQRHCFVASPDWCIRIRQGAGLCDASRSLILFGYCGIASCHCIRQGADLYNAFMEPLVLFGYCGIASYCYPTGCRLVIAQQTVGDATLLCDDITSYPGFHMMSTLVLCHRSRARSRGTVRILNCGNWCCQV